MAELSDIYNDGFQDFLNGLEKVENPYSFIREMDIAWFKGWSAAASDHPDALLTN